MRVVVLDPGVLLNAVAGEFLHQLRSPDLRFVIPQTQTLELTLWSEELPIHRNADTLVASGLIDVTPLKGEAEMQLLIDYAALAEESEAAAAALAHSRDWVLATDEIKLERQFLRKSGEKGQTVSTLRLLKDWSQVVAATAPQMSEVLRRLQSLALFSPLRSAIEYDWWLSQCKLSGIPQRGQ
ncbi:MAG: hypothetical protein QOH88_1738 [Verrucomicrobiota bacterium]|jgi:hypothetical protein